MSNYRERKSVVALGEVMDRATAGRFIPERFPNRKSGETCPGCGDYLWEGRFDGRWQLMDCLNCLQQQQQQEFIAETLQAQAEKSKTLYSTASFENFVTTAEYQARGLMAARDFWSTARKGQPVALLLWSAPTAEYTGYGTGKTHLASAIANALRESIGSDMGWNILSWLAPDLFSEVKSTYGNDEAEQTEWQIIRMATECDLLVFDDIGKEHVRDTNRSWHHDLYYRIINARYQRGPLIVTTNIDAEMLPAHIGGGAFSRLWEMCGGKKRIIKMCGPDYRFIDKEK